MRKEKGMKKTALILLLALGFSAPLSAATRTDVNVLEATESIRYLSQEITKNYLYLFANPQKSSIKKKIHRSLNKLVENIRTISTSTSDEDTRTVLEFLIYSKDQIEELVKENPDKEKAALMLDYSETLLEGANSIARAHNYEFTESEKMLMKGKRIEYLLERSAKYYMALGVGLGTEINRKQMMRAIETLEKNLEDIEAYDYPAQMKKSQTSLRQSWEVTKSFFDRREKTFVSNLMVLSSEEMESITREFILYHRKTQ
jgi:hypothetical protein